MEWIITFIALGVAWYFYQKNSGDVAVKRVRAVTFLLEQEGGRLRSIDMHRFNTMVEITTGLRIGINALSNNQKFLLSDDVVSIFGEFACHNEILPFLIPALTPDKYFEINKAFKECHERLLIMQSDAPMISTLFTDCDDMPPVGPPLGSCYAAQKPNSCPNCNGQRVVDVLYGYPDDDSFQRAAQGKLILGGCMHDGDGADWQCVDCKLPIFLQERARQSG